MMQNTMEWYVVKMIFQVVQDAVNEHPQFDEQFRLIRADSAEWALQKAGTLGKLEDSTFLNSHRHEVQWKFIAVVDVSKLDSLEDGAELYANTAEPKDVPQYLDIIYSRAKVLPGMVSLKAKIKWLPVNQEMYKLN